MVEEHKEENGELETEREEKRWTEGQEPVKRERRRRRTGSETERQTDRQREEEEERGKRKREKGSSASLPDNDRQCSKGQPHCTTRYCAIHRIHN